jgi:hypothetical protein
MGAGDAIGAQHLKQREGIQMPQQCVIPSNAVLQAERGISRATALDLPRLENPLKSNRLLQLPFQRLHHQPDRLFIPSIPSPLPLLRCLNETGLRQNRHVVRNRRLREIHAFFDVSGAQTRIVVRCGLSSGLRLNCSFFERLQNPPPRGIGNGVKCPVKRCASRHDWTYEYRENR